MAVAFVAFVSVPVEAVSYTHLDVYKRQGAGFINQDRGTVLSYATCIICYLQFNYVNALH